MPVKQRRQNWEAWLPIVSGQDNTFRARIQRGVLYVLSGLYRLGLCLRDRRWRRSSASVRVAVPVISVGNLTTGGTGKTPFVKWICRYLRERELRVAILSRGYQATDTGVNDEALELELALPDVPHLQDPDRRKVAQIAIEELESECLVLDDGFQHRQLQRDLDIVLIDATNPFGYGFTLPRGLLREPISALRRADVIVMTRSDQVSDDVRSQIRRKIEANCRDATIPILETIHQPTGLVDCRGRRRPLDELQNQSVLAFAGIGNPQAFFQTLQALGAHPLATRTFPDHHAYTPSDVQELRAWAKERQLEFAGQSTSPLNSANWLVITTQKDLVKLQLAQMEGVDLVALEIEIAICVGEAQLSEILSNTLRLE